MAKSDQFVPPSLENSTRTISPSSIKWEDQSIGQLKSTPCNTRSSASSERISKKELVLPWLAWAVLPYMPTLMRPPLTSGSSAKSLSGLP